MVNTIKTSIQSKYYTYVPGEFMPVYEDGQLSNRAQFHQYKLRRTAWRLQNLKATYSQLTHSQG